MTATPPTENDHPHIHDNPRPHFTRMAHAALRIMTGFLFAQHGAQKLFGVLGGMGQDGGAAAFGTLMWVAGILEFVGGIMVALGILTRPTAFILSGQMAVAYFWRHLPNGFWPIQNRGELAALFCFIFLYFAAAGPGGYSIHSLLRRRKTP